MDYINLLDSSLFTRFGFLFSVICGILISVSFIFFYMSLISSFRGNSFLLFVFFLLLFLGVVIFYVLCSEKNLLHYERNINYKVTGETRYVSFLPNQILNSETNTFIIDEKELEVTKVVDVKYIQDSKEKPYIIYEKVTYEAPYKWYMSKKSIKEINDTTKYVLKEVHY